MESKVHHIILRYSELVNSTSSKKRQLILIQKNIFTVHSLDCCSQTSNSGASSHSPSSSKAAWSSCERKCETASRSCPKLWNIIWMPDVPWEMNNKIITKDLFLTHAKLGEFTSPVEGHQNQHLQVQLPRGPGSIIPKSRIPWFSWSVLPTLLAPPPRVLPNRPVVDHQAMAQRHLQLPGMGGGEVCVKWLNSL